MKFSIVTNAQEIADKIGVTASTIAPRLSQEVEKLSVMAHADVIQHAQEKLSGSILDKFLGPNGQNVRWEQVAPRMWVVSIDPSVAYIEEGAPKKFMDWLLNNNPKAKTNKKGEKYAVIPIKNAQWTGAGKAAVNRRNSVSKALIEQEMKRNKISLTGIDKDSSGKPKLGVVTRINPELPGPQSQYPSLFSTPRSAAMAQLTGLPMHGGIAHTQGTVITQRVGNKGKIVREAVTFRVIHESHEQEGRWFLKPVQPLNSLQNAYDLAVKRMDEIVAAMQAEFGGKV